MFVLPCLANQQFVAVFVVAGGCVSRTAVPPVQSQRGLEQGPAQSTQQADVPADQASAQVSHIDLFFSCCWLYHVHRMCAELAAVSHDGTSYVTTTTSWYCK